MVRNSCIAIKLYMCLSNIMAFSYLNNNLFFFILSCLKITNTINDLTDLRIWIFNCKKIINRILSLCTRSVAIYPACQTNEIAPGNRNQADLGGFDGHRQSVTYHCGCVHIGRESIGWEIYILLQKITVKQLRYNNFSCDFNMNMNNALR